MPRLVRAVRNVDNSVGDAGLLESSLNGPFAKRNISRGPLQRKSPTPFLLPALLSTWPFLRLFLLLAPVKKSHTFCLMTTGLYGDFSAHFNAKIVMRFMIPGGIDDLILKKRRERYRQARLPWPRWPGHKRSLSIREAGHMPRESFSMRSPG